MTLTVRGGQNTDGIGFGSPKKSEPFIVGTSMPLNKSLSKKKSNTKNGLSNQPNI